MQIWRALLCHGKVYFYSFEGAIKKSLFVAGKCSATHKQNEENDFVHLVLELLQFNELIPTQTGSPPITCVSFQKTSKTVCKTWAISPKDLLYMCGVAKQFVILIILSRVSILFALLCLPFSMKWHHVSMSGSKIRCIGEKDDELWGTIRSASTVEYKDKSYKIIIQEDQNVPYTKVMLPSLSDDYNLQLTNIKPQLLSRMI